MAWITERKNVLSAVFYFSSALIYLRFAGFVGAERPKRFYWYALMLFIAALMSKTVTASLPAALLLLVWWRNGRIRKADVFPLLPFFALGIAFGALTGWVEHHYVGAQGADWAFTPGQRLLVAGRALWFYAGKLVWPDNLIFSYPRWEVVTSAWWQWLFPLAAGLLVVALWFLRHRWGRGSLVAVLFFAGTLFPALGFINVYPMRYSFVADHFQYLAMVGPIALAMAGIVIVLKHKPFLIRTIGGTSIVVLGLLTWKQCQMYASEEVLWRTTIAKNPYSWMAYDNLGLLLFSSGRTDDAIANYEKALEINPTCPEAHDNLGEAFLQKGNVDEAILQFEKTLEIEPRFVAARVNIGGALLQRGETDKAIAYLQQALELSPRNAAVHNNLGNALMQSGRVQEAINHYQEAIKFNPAYVDAYNNIAGAFYKAGKANEAIAFYQKTLDLNPQLPYVQYNLGIILNHANQNPEAIIHFKKAVEIKPDYVEGHNSLGWTLARTGQTTEAVAHYRRALEIQSQYVPAQNNLAWLMATCPDAKFRNGSEAVDLSEQASRLSRGTNPGILQTLAAAYAETGRFPEAIATADRALQLAVEQNNDALGNALKNQIKLYKAGSPFRDK